MAEFSIWHVLPSGEMPTVRQVLEMGGGTWMTLENGRPTIKFKIEPGFRQQVWWKYASAGLSDWCSYSIHDIAVTNPRPIEAPMPTPADVGTESRWVVMCLFGLRSADRKFSRDACTLRTVNGQVEALFDGDDQWVPLASQWGAGMVAVKESTCTSA